MRSVVLAKIIILFSSINGWAQLNKYSVGLDYSPIANSFQAPLSLTFISVESTIPYKIEFSLGEGTPISRSNYTGIDEYTYNFVYLKPGVVIRIRENGENKSLVVVSVNFNFYYINQDFTTRVTDNFGTSKLVRFNGEAYSAGYQIELIKYKNVGYSMFNFHYGIGIGTSMSNTDVLSKYIKTQRGYFSKYVPGIGSGVVLFIGIGTRLYKSDEDD